ncbi:MAG: sulfur-carrier protein [Actinomycetota bacterium]|nr:sulfur-carrier protein [Actinomycetota bacterium]
MVTVRYYAGARAAAGTDSEPVLVDSAATVEQLSSELSRLHGAALSRVLPVCTFLIDETASDQRAPLPSCATVDVLPPFAGG